MLRTTSAIISLAVLTAPSLAQAPQVTDRLLTAVAIEYAIANCDVSKVPVMYLGMSQMVINGSDPATVTAAREQMQERSKANFATMTDACASIEGWLNSAASGTNNGTPQ